MTLRTFCLMACWWFAFAAAAQKIRSHALIIGINQYRPDDKEAAARARGFGNLDGAVNDALAFKMLLTARLGFRSADVQLITDQEATAERIRKEFRAILQKAKPGEQVLIYYAGHGSQVRNPLSQEPDKLDETIVPADAWRGSIEGKLYDIRDKEIARMVYPYAKAGVLITLIFDSCHSGSATRAASGRLGKVRKVEPSAVVLEDSTDVPALEEAGVLILTAAQDFQAAQEYYDTKGNPHGAFTYALMQAIRQSGRRESVQSLFLRTCAQLKALGLKQEPVLLSNEQRRQKPLILLRAEEVSEESALIVTVAGKTDNGILIEGGPAIGIYENTILQPVAKRLLSLSVQPRLRVKQLLGVNRALCVVEQGDARQIQTGDAWEVVEWAAPERSRLRVQLPVIESSVEMLEREAAEFAKRATLHNIRLTDRSDAPFALFYRGKQWQLQDAAGSNLTQATQLDKLSLAGAEGSAIYWLLPLPQAIAENLKTGLQSRQSIQFTDEQTADYLLAGFYREATISYGWLHEEVSAEISPMPAFSAQLPVKDMHFTKNLSDYLVRLARIKNLLTIENPQGNHRFPYRLALVNAETKQVHIGDTLREGQSFGLRLQLDTAAAASWNGRRAWVYVFALDAEGTTSLLYPRSGNVENFLPAAGERPESIALGPERLLRITPPFGADTYITLLTDEPLPDPFLLQQKGIQTRAAEHPLSDLLLGTSETRSKVSMSGWQIYRRVFISQGK